MSPPPALVSTLRNHGSSYQFFTHIDEFLKTGLERGELDGPFRVPPFKEVHVSPLMTAVKKKTDSRRAVFDATFGDYSLNNNTPPDTYLHEPFEYDFPKIEDFNRIVLECGPGHTCGRGILADIIYNYRWIRQNIHLCVLSGEAFCSSLLP